MLFGRLIFIHLFGLVYLFRCLFLNLFYLFVCYMVSLSFSLVMLIIHQPFFVELFHFIDFIFPLIFLSNCYTL